jgi:hypothetical protein
MKYDINCIYVLKAYLKQDLVQQIPGFQNSMWFETKSLIGLSNPASDFLHCIRLFMNIEKM